MLLNDISSDEMPSALRGETYRATSNFPPVAKTELQNTVAEINEETC